VRQQKRHDNDAEQAGQCPNNASCDEHQDGWIPLDARRVPGRVRKIDALCQLRSMMRAICTARDRPEAFGAADARSLSRETRLGAYLSSGV
jgi:hypothetical protein